MNDPRCPALLLSRDADCLSLWTLNGHVTIYEAVGGEPTFRRLVDHFYAGVDADPVLRPLYPSDDMAGARERLTLFLIQYWGGPDTYSQQRGHPRLRMRHAPFVIGPRERDAWLRLMTEAVRSLSLPSGPTGELLRYFEAASTAMVNHIP